jgi:hypothetical protein
MRSIRIGVGLGVLLWAVIVTVVAWRGCRKDVTRHSGVLAQVQDSGRYWRDAYNREHATRLVVEADRDVVRALYPGMLDSMARLLKVKPRRIETVTGANAKVHDTITAPMWYKDSVGREGERCFAYGDEWTTVTGCVDTTGKVALEYSIDVPVTVVTYWKRRWLLGRKRRYVDATSNNPNVKLEGLSKVLVK